MRIYLLTLILALPHSVVAEQNNKSGKLAAYIGAPPEVVLTEKEQNKLIRGKTVYKKINISGGKRAVAIFPVNASADNIWNVIRAFHSYPDWIDSVSAIEIYQQKDNIVSAKYTANHFIAGEIIWHTKHDYPTDHNKRNWGTWTLDANRVSDIKESVGFWRVIPISDAPSQHYVFYSAEIRLKGKIPDFIESIVINKGLKEASQWVKLQAEQLATSNDQNMLAE